LDRDVRAFEGAAGRSVGDDTKDALLGAGRKRTESAKHGTGEDSATEYR